MTEQKRERGIKVMTRRAIWTEGADGKPKKEPVGTILTLSQKQVKQYGTAVTRDLPDLDDE